MSKRSSPVPRAVYTLRQIVDELYLPDAPCLQIYTGMEGSPIRNFYPLQDSHFTYQELLRVDGWADTKWTYKYTTEEMIPVFHAMLSQSFRFLIDVAPDYNSHSGQLWLTPKAFPLEQYKSA